LLVAGLLLAIFPASSCKRSGPSRAAKEKPSPAKAANAAERRQVAARFEAAMERAGGSEVWVKGSELPGMRTPRGDAAVEVLARTSAFDPVLDAFRAEARREGLEIRQRELGSEAARRVLELSALEPPPRGSHQPVGRWRLRAVARLYRAAIVIDDLGQKPEAVRRLLELPYPLTFSVLPHLPDSAETAEQAHRAHREVMLHLPMQAEPGSALTPGPGALRVGMGPAEVSRTIEDDLASVPYATGVNNHMGSRATADAALMAAVMKVLAGRRLYFIDSRTTAATVALDAARAAGLPTFYRSVFLDDEENVGYTLGQLRKFRELVDRQGVALAIGHPHPTTMAALARFLPELERDDIELVPASELVRLPEVARLKPPRPAPASR
jgi:uncharacterized protein